MTLGPSNERETKYHRPDVGWNKRLISWPLVQATNHTGSAGRLTVSKFGTASSRKHALLFLGAPSSLVLPDKLHIGCISERHPHRTHVFLRSIIGGMGLVSLVLASQGVEEWGPALSGANENARAKGLTRKWSPACNPTTKCPLSSSGRATGDREGGIRTAEYAGLR